VKLAIGALCFSVLGLMLSSYALGRADAERDIAARYWEHCRTYWTGFQGDWRRNCSDDMEAELGLKNKWGFR
jgi:hypothetical protein